MLDVLLFFLLWIIITGLLTFFLGIVLHVTAGGQEDGTLVMMLSEALMLVSVGLASVLLLRLRKKPFSVLGLSVRWRDAAAGFLAAVLLYAVGFGLSLALGLVEVDSASFEASPLLQALAFFLLVGITEEWMMRGFVLGRLLDGGINRFVALFLSSLFFSLLHLFNPGFSFLSFLNLLLAGMLLGASYLYTRNLTFPIVLHWFWNWIQGPVLGYNVSGNDFGGSIFRLRLSGNALWNGGGFGFEGSLLCTVLMLIGTGAILSYYERKRGGVVHA